MLCGTRMFSAATVEGIFRLYLLISLAITVKSAHKNGDLSLWIDEQQVKMFSGFAMEIYAIVDGHVLPYILDPKFEQYLPIIPSEVAYVNFTWKSGVKKYNYHFDNLQSFDETILEPPVISIKTKGRVPRRPKVFSVFLPCSGNNSGIASFGIGLQIETRKGRALPGTPLRLRLRKECVQRGGGRTLSGPDPECDKRCANGGWCNHDKICQCPEGYMGQYCKTALCYPQCMNGGSCTSPGTCSCPIGFQGRHCEGGICAEKCLNGGKCIQKDTCECPKGYYGLRCEFSKCIVPCLNGGRCHGVNKCRCPGGFRGDHCEIGRRVPQRSLCSKPCRHGTCQADNTCLCDDGWFGRQCHQKNPHHGNSSRHHKLDV
ncbi:protein shifted isoform X2 [Bacillus rossius redtenbacheri]|uniref:protein shifted isoform X2 n=1 Tax=Bacillus rossius redtenbacheri TaxID=93214 RepID=UPI002FDC8F3C